MADGERLVLRWPVQQSVNSTLAHGKVPMWPMWTSQFLWPWMSSVSAVKLCTMDTMGARQGCKEHHWDTMVLLLPSRTISQKYQENWNILGFLLTTVFFFLIKMTFSFKMFLNVLQELQGVHIVDRCSAVPSESMNELKYISMGCLCVLWCWYLVDPMKASH